MGITASKTYPGKITMILDLKKKTPEMRLSFFVVFSSVKSEWVF